MKKVIFMMLLGLAIQSASAQYPLVPIDSVQYISPSRLSQVQFAIAGADGTLPDFIVNTAPNIATGDTVTIEGVVMFDPDAYGLSTSRSRQATYIQANVGGVWKGVEVMYDSAVQPVNQSVVLFRQNMKKGRIVRVTGRIRDFQGMTQLTVINQPTEVISLGPVAPAPVLLEVEDFVKLVNGTQTPQFVSGEPYEGVYVEFRNVTVVRDVNSIGPNLSRYIWFIQDANGNRISIRDVSGYFRNDNFDEDPNTPVNFNPPPQGSIIPYIRGIITESGNGSFKSYFLAPLYPDDVSNPIEPPSIEEVGKSPSWAKSTDIVNFRATIKDSDGVQSARLFYAPGYNNNNFVAVNMTSSGNDLFTASIPAQPNGTIVKYFIAATDNNGNTSYFPDSIGLNSAYQVFDAITAIKQIQETPLPSGASLFTNDTLTGIELKAVVTATINTWDLGMIVIQTDNQPWNSIFVRWGQNDNVRSWRRGDSVLIKRAIVTERIPLGSNPFGRTGTSGVTFIEEIGAGNWELLGSCLKLQESNKVPFDSLMSNTFNKEPYENTLLELNDVWVVLKNADSITGGNFGEFAVNPDVTARTGFRGEDFSPDLFTNRVSDSLNQNGLDFLPVFRGYLVNAYGNWKLFPRNRTDMSKAGNLVPPYITLKGADTLVIVRGEAINDPGADVCDDEFGDLSTALLIDSSSVNSNVVGTYTVLYNAQDPAGNPALERERIVVVTNGTNLMDVTSTLRIYPNPAINQLIVQWNEGNVEDQAHIRILNMEGKTVYQSELNAGENKMISVAQWPTGVYICQFISNGMIKSEKVSIIH